MVAFSPFHCERPYLSPSPATLGCSVIQGVACVRAHRDGLIDCAVIGIDFAFVVGIGFSSRAIVRPALVLLRLSCLLGVSQTSL